MRLDELTEADARAIALWRYPPPYDCYDYPAWAQMARDGWAICDATARREQFRALSCGRGSGDGPAGYVRFRPGSDSLVIHLGPRRAGAAWAPRSSTSSSPRRGAVRAAGR